MAVVQLWLSLIGNALLSLFIQPFFYVALIAMALLLMYRTKLERHMFHVKLYPKVPIFLKSLLAGIIVAIIVSIVSGFLGLTMTKDTIYLVWIIQVILMLFKFRLLSIVYSSSIIILLHEVFIVMEPLQLPEPIHTLYTMLLNVSSFSLAFIVALIIIAQSIMLRIQGKNFLTPIYVAGKRGKVVGGYTLQAVWAIPLLLFVPVSSTTAGAIVFDTTVAQPLFLQTGPEAWILLALPIMLGSTAISTSLTPDQIVKKMSLSLLILGVITLLLVVLVWWVPLLIWAIPFILLLSYSVQRAVISSYEANHSPIFINGAVGLKVLAIIDKSTSDHLQIKVGEIIKRVNGQEVNTVSELYEAIALNPAFCKLEVLDKNGEIRFVQRTRYENEHHQLGLILVPQQQVSHIKSFRYPSIFSIFAPKIVERKIDNSNI